MSKEREWAERSICAYGRLLCAVADMRLCSGIAFGYRSRPHQQCDAIREELDKLEVMLAEALPGVPTEEA